jgi:nucleotide-binding universal stress UspA family protein
MYNKILVPLDGSELAEQVLPHVTQLAGCTGAEIVLLRVPTEPMFDYIVPDPEIAVEMRRDLETGAQAYLAEISEELRSMGLRCSVMVAWGTPIHDTILDVARQVQADLITMSTHGRSGFARMVIGSIADEVVRHAPVPVLLVRPDIPRVTHEKTGLARVAA